MTWLRWKGLECVSVPASIQKQSHSEAMATVHKEREIKIENEILADRNGWEAGPFKGVAAQAESQGWPNSGSNHHRTEEPGSETIHPS